MRKLKRDKNDDLAKYLNQNYWYYKCFRLLERYRVATSIRHASETSGIDMTLRSGHAF
jgi:hypothetical protein